MTIEITYEERVKIRRRFSTSMRLLWMESPYRNKALALAKERVLIGKYKNGKDKYKVKYRCAKCDNLFEEGNVEVDHIKELTRARWDIPMNEDVANLVPWLESLFCELDNLQVLCIRCHAKKTARYAAIRELGVDLL